ncbi:548_t:CDS:2, partial [Gigaspora margarita]
SIDISFEKGNTRFKQCDLLNETLRINLNMIILPDSPITEQILNIYTCRNTTRSFENSTIFASSALFNPFYANDSRTFIPSTEIGGQFNMTNTVGPLPKGHKLYLLVEMFEKDKSYASNEHFDNCQKQQFYE